MIKLYHTNCPQCRGIELKLKMMKIEYESILGEDKIKELGFCTSPVLEVDGKFYVGGKACLDYLNGRE